MDKHKHLSTALLITLIVIFSIYNKAQASSLPQVHTLSKSPPLVLSDSIKVQTITKGLKAANDPVYKVMNQTVSKALFSTVFRSAVRFSPYGLAALIAWDYFLGDDGEIYTKSDGVANCQTGSLNFTTTLANCARTAVLQKISETRVDEFLTPYFDHSGNRWVAPYKYHNTNNPSWIMNGTAYFSFGEPSDGEDIRVTDDELMNSLLNYTNLSNDIFKNADGSVNQDYFPDPDFQYISDSDAVLMDLYGSGLLQSTDPTADNYITPEDLARIKALYDEANKTDDEKADDLTADVDKPITKSQHEENLLNAKKALDLENASIASEVNSALDLASGNLSDFEKSSNDGWDSLTEMLNTTNALPDSSLAGYFDFTSSTTCETVALPFIGVFPSVTQCDKLHTFRDAFGWFLAILVAWNIAMMMYKEAN